MRTTIDLPDDAYKLVKALADKRRMSMGNLIAETLVRAYGPSSEQTKTLGRSRAGFPTLTAGHPITEADVDEIVNE